MNPLDGMIAEVILNIDIVIRNAEKLVASIDELKKLRGQLVERLVNDG